MKKTYKALLIVCLVASWPAAWAADGRFYAGIVGNVEEQDGRYYKSTYTAENFARGTGGHHGRGRADKTVYGLGGVAGYKWPLTVNGNWYLSGEVEVLFHKGKIRGTFAGTGQQFAENWPEDWSLEKDYSWGATLKLGGAPKLPGVASDLNLYVLAGIRRVETEFKIRYTGCPSTAPPCPPESFITGTESYDRAFTAWTAGVGLEKPLGENSALQMEARYTDYHRKRWTSLPAEGAVVVPAALSGHELGLSLRLIRYF